MNTTHPQSPDELRAKIKLKTQFLGAARLVAGSMTSEAAATKVAGLEAAQLKEEIAALEAELAKADADKSKG